MRLNDRQEEIIDRWLSAVETGKPGGDYGAVTVYADNPRSQAQITYGKHQTTETGKRLQALVRRYLAREDKAASETDLAWLRKFVAAPQYSMTGSEDLLAALEQVGRTDPAMADVQNEFFLEEYLKPSRRWAEENGFTLPLSLLVIYDSFIQSGGIPWWIRRRFAEAPPAAGGSEKAWISQYVLARHQWLKGWGDGRSGKSQAIRASAYRTRGLLREIERENWELSEDRMVVNGIEVI